MVKGGTSAKQGPSGPVFFCAKKFDQVLEHFMGLFSRVRTGPVHLCRNRAKNYKEVLIDLVG